MSETAEPEVEIVAPPPPVAVPAVQRVSPADINEMGVWLFPRIEERWRTSSHHVRGWLTGALPANDQALVRCGNGIGMAHVEPGRMGHPCRIVVDFVLHKEGMEGDLEIEQIYHWIVRWAKSHQARGVFGIDDFADVDRSYVRQWIGKLTKRETFSVIF